MLKPVVLITLAVVAVVALGAIMLFGASRHSRLRRFVAERGGEWSRYDAFDLQPSIDALFAPGEWWVGVAGRLEAPDESGGRIHLLELHSEPDGPARRTAVLVAAREATTDEPCSARERLPSSETVGEETGRFVRLGAGELPTDWRRRLDELPDDRDWLLELHATPDRVLVSSRERPLSERSEWNQLLATTRHLLPAPEP